MQDGFPQLYHSGVFEKLGKPQSDWRSVAAIELQGGGPSICFGVNPFRFTLILIAPN
jgi:hypothetical protein